jgi:molybdate transport system substrate-binding protein
MTRSSTLPGRAAGGAPPQAAVPAARPSPLARSLRALAPVALLAAIVASLLGGAGACGSGGQEDAVTLHVLAASSLSEAFTRIGAAFQKDHPGVKVVFDFAGSQDLVAQIGQGAPADVLATADTATMDGVAGKVTPPRVFATNRLAIAVAPGNPLGVTGLASLADPALKVVLAAPEVPAGKYAQQVLARAGAAVKPVSLEESVKGVVTKIALGEADAGIVYVTDVHAAGGKIAGLDIPAADNVTATYPIAALRDSASAADAQAFVDYVLSTAGQQTLRDAGFGAQAP